MLKKIIKLIKLNGFIGLSVYTLKYLYKHIQKKLPPYKLVSEHARYPLYCRWRTSDNMVFEQIFIEREYSCIDDLPDVDLIIDCGANVGYSSAYFLSRFKNSYLIAIEPDLGNYSVMRKNLRPYINRVKMINAGIWSHSAPLTMSEMRYRDGEEWSYQVRECREGEKALFLGKDIGSILKESKHDRISILKMDIEGAEGVVFSSPSYKEWLGKVDVILIELHDDSSFGKCSDIFLSAIKDEEFDVSHCGELTVCKRRVKA